MGARLYNPKNGNFLSPDPIAGGNATAYTYPSDPVNDSDPSGLASSPCSDGDADMGCDEMFDACEDYSGYVRCVYLFSLLKHLVDVADSAKALVGDNAMQAARHFAFVVIVAVYTGRPGLGLGLAIIHEAYGQGTALDHDRDSRNNLYAYGWYSRHEDYAKDMVGRFSTNGDVENLFEHGLESGAKAICTAYAVGKGTRRSRRVRATSLGRYTQGASRLGLGCFRDHDHDVVRWVPDSRPRGHHRLP